MSNKEKTLSIIKPDAVERNLEDEIKKIFIDKKDLKGKELINNKSEHAERFTSPLKYFEYIASGLKVVASDSKSHRILPYQECINYFDFSKSSSFIDAVNNAINSEQPTYDAIQQYSMSQRALKILNFYFWSSSIGQLGSLDHSRSVLSYIKSFSMSKILATKKTVVAAIPPPQ